MLFIPRILKMRRHLQ